jgi:hypothetical protein
MKIIITALLVIFVLTSCAPIAIGVPTNTTVPMADDFSFVFTDYGCGTIPFDVLDTKTGILTHTPLEETTSTTISLQLSESQLNEVFHKLIAMDFFSYPSEFSIPEQYFALTETPTTAYELNVINGTVTNTVHWTTGGLAESEYKKATQLWELLKMIKLMIYNHPEYQQLPLPMVECV